jgi:hypothetical protein
MSITSKKLFFLFILSGYVLATSRVFEDAQCNPVRLSHAELSTYRAKPNICTLTNATQIVLNPDGTLLLAGVVENKVRTVYDACAGAFITTSSIDGVVGSPAVEYAEYNVNAPVKKTCFIQDFGPPIGLLKGTTSSIGAFTHLQVIEYTKPDEDKSVRGQQVLETDIPGTQHGERLMLSIFYPPEQGNGLFILLTAATGDAIPLSECDDIAPPNELLPQCASGNTARAASASSASPASGIKGLAQVIIENTATKLEQMQKEERANDLRNNIRDYTA